MKFMVERKNEFRLLLLLFAVMPITLTAQKMYDKPVLYETWNTGNDSLIYKEIATHRIVNEDLRNLIIEYDNMYSEFVRDSLVGITVSCRESNHTITYVVYYTADISGFSPIVLCEPINGREVHLYLGDLHHQVQLPYQRGVELLKNSYPRQYERLVIQQREAIKENRVAKELVTSDFVEWHIVFYKHTGECLFKFTPDKTGQYRKDPNWSEDEFVLWIRREMERERLVIAQHEKKNYNSSMKSYRQTKRHMRRHWREMDADLKKEDQERRAKNQQ
jgi:hypothetical protein